jgi:cell division septal protein FtsQ
MNSTARLECDGALSDLILQAARQAIPADVNRLITLPDSGRRNQPLLPLLVGLLDATQQVAQAVADNAWDESLPLDRELMTDLARQSRAIATAIETASACPDSST